MSGPKYFRLRDGKATLFTPKREPSSLQTAVSEKELQTLCENNLEVLFGVRFLQTECSVIGGRMDTLGLDEHNRPTIIEYKKGPNKYLINQTAYYSKCLQKFLRPAFEDKVRLKFGDDEVKKINWNNNPRLICVAAGFTEEDIALQEIIETLELVRYRLFDGNPQGLKLEWKPKAIPYGSLDRTLDDMWKDYLYWQNYINGLGEEGTILEEFRCEDREVPHQAFYRQTKEGKRAGFAILETRDYPIKIWARKNFVGLYRLNSSWHTPVYTSYGSESLESIKKLLRYAYEVAHETAADD